LLALAQAGADEFVGTAQEILHLRAREAFGFGQGDPERARRVMGRHDAGLRGHLDKASRFYREGNPVALGSAQA
jgi:hypothetical protein